MTTERQVLHIAVAQRLTMAHAFRGGMEAQAHGLAAGLRARGHALLTLTTPHPDGRAEGSEPVPHSV